MSRLKRGVNWHAWVWEADDPAYRKHGTDGLFYVAYPDKPKDGRATIAGRWVRVRFVKVSKRRRGA